MSAFDYEPCFSQQVLDDIFPSQRADRFFDALLGDAKEGAYDIRLAYNRATNDHIEFEFQLNQRPGRCLACNLTYGLPEVFMRHPVIDLAGLVRSIGARLPNGKQCGTWELGRTTEISRQRHVIPLRIGLTDAQ